MTDIAKPPRPAMAGLPLARLVLALIGLLWLIVGLLGLFAAQWLADVVDYRLESNLARFEFRAMYGGLCVAIATLHAVAVARKVWIGPALVCTGVLLVGLLSGRLLALVVDGFPGVTGAGFAVIEAVGITLVLVAMWRRRGA